MIKSNPHFKLLTLLFLSAFIFSCSNSSEGNKKEGDNQKEKVQEIPSYDVSELQKLSEPMDEGKFWVIIDEARDMSSNQTELEQNLISLLIQMSPEEMIGFKFMKDKLTHATYTQDQWCACYLMNGGCSDDGFDYFRSWVVAQGKDAYYMALENPDYLVNLLDRAEYFEFESLDYVSNTAFEKTTGKDIYDFMDYATFNKSLPELPEMKFNWSEDKPETMKAICPELYKKMWE